MFQPIQSLFHRTANKIGIGQEFHAIQICKAAEHVMEDCFKNFDIKNTRPKNFQKGWLTIEVCSSAWGQEVIMRKEKIISELNQKMGRKVIKDLRTRLRR